MKEFINGLQSPDPNWPDTGAIYREPGIKDFHLENKPEVRAAAAELPPSYSVLPPDKIQIVYNQVGPSCTANSECGAKTIEDFFDLGFWVPYDANELYIANGGDGINGISSDLSLRYIRDIGCLEVGTKKRRKISGYAFTPQYPGMWEQTLAAALVATGPCVVATLLPSSFGWDSSGNPTSAYHQMCLIGYEGMGDDDYWIFLNSWGRLYGKNGFYRIKLGYLKANNFQDRWCYGFQMIDVDDPPEPAPDPPIGLIRFDGRVKFKREGKKIFLFPDLPNTALAGLQGHAVEVSQPFAFKANVGAADSDRVVLKPVGQILDFSGQAHIELRLAE